LYGDDEEDEIGRSNITSKPMKNRKIGNAIRAPALPKFNFGVLPIKEREKWNTACDMFQLEFLFSSTFLGERQRLEMARKAINTCVLKDSGKMPSSVQTEAVRSSCQELLKVGKTTIADEVPPHEGMASR
jgi:hypothetical protein